MKHASIKALFGWNEGIGLVALAIVSTIIQSLSQLWKVPSSVTDLQAMDINVHFKRS